MGISFEGVPIVFQIVDFKKIPETDRFRFSVETSDPSLFDLLHQFVEVAEFIGVLTYRVSCARRVSENESKKEMIEEKNRVDRARMLDVYESINGSQKDRWNVILVELKASGKDWMRLDDVIVLLKIARSERKESIQKSMELERKKSA